MMTRDEHIDWCKQRALEYVDAGDLVSALSSMISDLTKHEETRKHPGTELGVMMSMGGHLDSAHEMRKFIEGFH